MNLRILYVSNGYELPLERVKAYNALQKLASEIAIVFTFKAGYKRTFFDKLLYFFKLPTDPCKLNLRLIEKATEFEPDVIFVVKGVNILPSTILKLKQTGAKLISWSNDDMFGWHNRSLYYTWGLRYYDLVVTQKSYNCNQNELPSLGARRILFQDKAYDRAMHFPIDNCKNSNFCFDVVFVGTYEKQRLERLLYLADNGIIVHVFGWAKNIPAGKYHNLVFHNQHLYGHDYATVFSCSKISLNFLRRKNRDLQTSRTIEIPACKGFMLAERTTEQSRLFIEDKEAVFFERTEELLDKVIYYLKHIEERNAIAEAGYKRCINSDYSFDNRMKQILEEVTIKIEAV